jgi:hypothetical protein
MHCEGENAECFERKIEGKCSHNPQCRKRLQNPAANRTCLPISFSRNVRYFFITVPNGEVYLPSNSFQVTAGC